LQITFVIFTLKEERIILIMDNARYNHARLVREHIAGTVVEIVYLPPYSPNLNLVERMWRFMKKKVMRNQFYKTFAEFIATIKRFFARISDYTDELSSLMRDKFHILECA
jgi:transposase